MRKDYELQNGREPLSTQALCVRFCLDQEREIESLARRLGVSQARIVRDLVARGLAKAPDVQ